MSTPAGPGSGGLDVRPYTLDDELVELTRADRRSRIAVYPFTHTSVVLGRGSDPGVELDVAAVRDDGVPVLRRRGGGCAVVLDRGNVIVTAALAIPGIERIRSTFERLTRWLIEGLARSGVADVASGGVSDLVIGDRKIAGSCVHRQLGLFTYSASLLFEPDVSSMTRYLAHPPREPAYRRGRAHDAFVAAIAGAWQPSADEARAPLSSFVARLRDELMQDREPLDFPIG